MSRNLLVQDIDNDTRTEIIKALTVDNPEYVLRKKRRKPTWGISAKLKLYILEGKSIICPRGFYTDLFHILAKRNVEIAVSMGTTKVAPVSFGKWNPEYELRERQRAAVDAVKNENGILVAPAGSGKTVMGLKYVQEIEQPTLWLTHTKDLFDQTVSKAYELLDGVGNVGTIIDGKVDYGDGKLIVAMVQTLAQRPELIEALDPLIGNVVIDECLTSDTLITMQDGTVKPITDINNGDLVVGGVVSNKFERQGFVYQVTTQSGILKCTASHKHIVYKNKHRQYTPARTFIPPNGQYVEILQTQDITEGDYLLLPLNIPHEERSAWTPEQLEFIALIYTDGHIDRNLCRVKVAIRRDFDYYRRMFRSGLEAFGYGNSYKESINCRGDLTLWSTNKELITLLQSEFLIPAGKKSNILTIPDTIFTAPLESISWFINTVFSVEGTVCCERKCNPRLVLDMTAPLFINQMQQLLLKFGIHSRTHHRRRNSARPNHSDVYRISIRGRDLTQFIAQIGDLKNLRKKVTMIFESAPFFTDYVITYKGALYKLAKIKKIEPLFETTVYDFTTTEHTFIANGIVTHNCHHTPSSTFITVLNEFSPDKMLGLTATTDRKDGLEVYMYRAIGNVVYRINRTELYEEGSLIKPEVRFIYTDFDYEPASRVSPYGAVDAGGEEDMDYRDLIDHLIADYPRAEQIAYNIVDNHAPGNYQIVLTESVRYCYFLQELVKAKALRKGLPVPRMAVIHGPIAQYGWRVAGSEFAAQERMQQGEAIAYRQNKKTNRWEVKVPLYTPEEFQSWQLSNGERKRLMQSARNKELDIIFCTQLAREGLDLPHLNRGHMAMPKRGDAQDSTNGAAVEQEIGRIMRPERGNPGKIAIWFDYVDNQVGVLNSQYYSRRKVYKRLEIPLPRRPKTEVDKIDEFLSSIKW